MEMKAGYRNKSSDLFEYIKIMKKSHSDSERTKILGKIK